MTVGIALIPAILGIIFLFMAIGGAGGGTCPGCGETLTNLGTGANDAVLCPKCLRYFEGKGGESGGLFGGGGFGADGRGDGMVGGGIGA